MKQHNIEITARMRLAVDSLKSDIAKMSSEIDNGLKAIGAPANLTKSFETQFSGISKSLNQMTERVHKGFQSASDFGSFSSNLTALESKLEGFQQRFQQLKLDPAQLLPDDAKVRIDGLTQALANARNTIQNLNSPATLNALRTQISDSATKVMELEAAYKDALKAATELNQKKNEKNNAYVQAKEDVKIYKDLLKDVEAEQAKITGEKTDLGKKWKNYRAEVAKANAEIQKLEAQQKALSKEDKKGQAGQQITQQIEQLKAQREALEKAADQGGYRTKEQVDGYKKGRIAELANEQRQLNAEIKNGEAAQSRANKEVDAYNAKLSQQKQIVRDSKAALDQQRDGLKQLRENLANIGLKGSSQAIANLKKEFEQLGVSADELKKLRTLEDFNNILTNLKTQELSKVAPILQNMGLQLQEFDGKLKVVKRDIEAGTIAQQKFDQQMSEVNALKYRIQYFFGLTNSIQLLRRTITSAMQTVKELDATMTEAAVVTNFSVSDMWEQLPKYSKEASRLGVSINSMYGATTLYYQQGLKTNQAMALGVETMKMAKIAGMESTEATEAMTAALRGFNMELNEASATNVNDVYSKLAAITAADTEQIATAMSKTASIAASANMEFETTAALLAQIIETTQEAPETAGTAMKTIIARFSEVKELKAQGKTTGEDEEGEEIDVNKIQGALRTVGISMDEFFAGTEGLDSVLLKLAEKWETLDFQTQRYIATTAAGSRQQSRFIAMMSDYSRTTDLVSAANNAAGASQLQYEKTLDSLGSKLEKLGNAWDKFLMGLADNELIKTGVDILTDLLELLNLLTQGFSSASSSVLKLSTAILGLKLGKKALLKLTTNLVSAFTGAGTQAGSEFYSGFLGTFSSGKGLKQKFSNLIFQNIDTGAMTQQMDNLARGFTSGTIPASQFNNEIQRIGMSVGASKEQIQMATQAMYDGADSQTAMGHLLPKTTSGINKQTKALNQQTMAAAASAIKIAALMATIWVVMEVSKAMTEAVDKNIITAEEQMSSFSNILDGVNSSLEKTQNELENFENTKNTFKQLTKDVGGLKKGTAEWGRAVLESRQQLQGILKEFPELEHKMQVQDGIVSLTDEGWELYEQKLLEKAQQLYGIQLTAQIGSNQANRAYQADNAGFKTSNITNAEQANIEKATTYSSYAGGAVGGAIGYIGGAALGAKIGAAIGTAAGPIGTAIGALAGVALGALGSWLAGSVAESISTSIYSLGFEVEALQAAGNMALNMEGGPFVAENASDEQRENYLEKLKSIDGLDIGEFEKFLKNSPQDFDAFIKSIQESTTELHNLATALGQQKAEEKGYSGETAERYASLIEYATQQRFGDYYELEQQKIMDKYGISYDNKNKEYQDDYKELYLEYGVEVLGLDSGVLNWTDAEHIFGEDFEMPTHAEIIQAVSLKRANDAIERYADYSFRLMATHLKLEDSNLIAKLLVSSNANNKNPTYTYQDYTFEELQRLKTFQDDVGKMTDEFIAGYSNYWSILHDYDTVFLPALQREAGQANADVFARYSGPNGEYLGNTSTASSSAIFLDGWEGYTEEFNDVFSNEQMDRMRSLMNDYLFDIWKKEEKARRDKTGTDRTVEIMGANIPKDISLETDGRKKGKIGWSDFEKQYSISEPDFAYLEATETRFKEAWDYAIEEISITYKDVKYSPEQISAIKSSTLWSDFLNSETIKSQGIVDETSFQTTMEKFPFLMEQSLGTIETFFDKMSLYSNQIEKPQYDATISSFTEVANLLKQQGQENILSTLINADWRNLGELRSVVDMTKKIPNISQEAVDGLENFVETCKETGLAIADIDLKQLTDQVSSINKIVDKINNTDTDKSFEFSDKELELMLSTGNVERGDFVATANGFAYIGEDIQDLRQTLLQTNQYLLSLQQDALKKRVQTATKAGVVIGEDGKVAEKTGVAKDYDWQTANQFSVTDIGNILNAAAQQQRQEGTSFTEGYVSSRILSQFDYDAYRSSYTGYGPLKTPEQFYTDVYNSLTDYQKQAIAEGFAQIGSSIENVEADSANYSTGLNNVQQQTLSLMTIDEIYRTQKDPDSGEVYSQANKDAAVDYILQKDQLVDYRNYLRDTIDMSNEMASRIAEDNNNMNQGVQLLATNYDKWAESIKNGPGSPEYSQSIAGLRKATEKLLGSTEGLSDEWLANEKNMKLFKRAAEGDTEAIEELQKSAANEFVVDLNLENFDENSEIIYGLIDSMVEEDIEIGATLDTSEFGSALYDILAASGATVDDINKAFDKIGWEPEIKYKEVPFSEAQQMNLTTTQEILVPDGTDENGVPKYKTTTMEAAQTGGMDGNTMVRIPILGDGSTYSSVKDSMLSNTTFSGKPKNTLSPGSAKKSSGGGKSKEKDWENPYDKHYNTLEQINEALREREKLERRYQRLLEQSNTKGGDLVKNAEQQIEKAEDEIALRKKLRNQRAEQIQEEIDEKGLGKYYSVTENEYGEYEIRIDWEAINAVKDEDEGQKIEDSIGDLEGWRDDINEQNDTVEDISDEVYEIRQQGKDEYFDLETRIKEALVQAQQDEIDKLSEINTSINDTNARLLETMQYNLEQERQMRENDKTEQELEDKQRRLEYLSQDTSGANALEIEQLQKEIDEGRESYTDTLIDQKISELQHQNDEAAEQRQRQIDIAQSQLQHYIDTGEVWNNVYSLMGKGIGANGVIPGSELETLLKDNDKWAGKSVMEKLKWGNDLSRDVALAIQYLKVGNSTESLIESKQLKAGESITFTTSDNTTLSGKVTENGDVVADGKTYTGIYRTYDGNWLTDEAYQGKITEPPQPETPSQTEEKKEIKVGEKINAKGAKIYDYPGAPAENQLFGNDPIYKVLAERDGYVQTRHHTLSRGVTGWFKKSAVKAYRTGGLADYTGPAWLDGTKSKPELVLNAQDTQNFIQLKNVLASLMSGTSKSSENIGDNTYDIDINVESIGSDYDVEQMAEKIKNLINQDARYRNNNTVSLTR